MQNHTHSDLDALKIQVQQAKEMKKARKQLEDNKDSVRGTDVLVVFRAEEIDILEGALLDMLSGEPVKFSRAERQQLMNLYKHLTKEDF